MAAKTLNVFGVGSKLTGTPTALRNFNGIY